MSVKISPKETIATIANIIVSSIFMSEGSNGSFAMSVGSIAEGIIKGIEFKDVPLARKWNKLMDTAVEQALESYTLPESCKIPLQENLFCPENFQRFILVKEPYIELHNMILEICASSPECDTKTLLVDEMTNSIIENLELELTNDHELMAIYDHYLIRQISNNIKGMKTEQLKNEFNSESKMLDESVNKIAYDSAAKVSQGLDKYLFAEESRAVKKTLEDVYVESHFCVEEKEYLNFEELYLDIAEEDALLIEGDAGMGKSSFVMKLAQKYLNGEIFSGRKVFFVCGKEIRFSKGKPIDDIKRILSIQSEEVLDNSILILDAYDEIAYASQSQEQNQAYLQKLYRDFEGVQLIITCRSDYIRKFFGKKVTLKGFDSQQRLRFLEKYNLNKPQEECVSKDSIEKLSKECSEDEEAENIEELLEIPMLLYMIAVSDIDVSDVTDRYSLYEKVFGSENALRKNRKTSKEIWRNCYILAQGIAHQMFLRNDPYIGKKLIYKQIELMNLPEEDMGILKNCFGIEVFLRGEDDRLYTFVHASIYEYFAAKWMCNHFHDVLIDWIVGTKERNVLIQELNNIFSPNYFNEKVFRYMMENINVGYYNSTLLTKEDYMLKLGQLMNDLMKEQLCISGDSSIPYIIRLKNMLLWTFNTFSILFGMVDIDDNPHWVKIDHNFVGYLLRSKDINDTLFLSHMDLSYLSVRNIDLGYAYLIDVNLSNADFSGSVCDAVRCIHQTFRSVDFVETKWNSNVLDGCACYTTDFSGSEFNDATIRNSEFIDCNFVNADFTDCTILDTVYENCDFRECYFSYTKFLNCTFKNVWITKSDLKISLLDKEKRVKMEQHSTEVNTMCINGVVSHLELSFNNYEIYE